MLTGREKADKIKPKIIGTKEWSKRWNDTNLSVLVILD